MALADGDPIVMTSRAEEYVEAVASGDVFTAAAVVALQPLGLPELEKYLPRTTRKAVRDGVVTTKWDPVFVRLRVQGSGSTPWALTDVLSTPLMTSLARITYSDADADPADLLDDRLNDPVALENHLLEALIPAVFPSRHVDRVARRAAWPHDDVRRWLTFLAAHAERLRTQEIAWWRLKREISRPRAALTLGLTFGLAGGILMGAGRGLAHGLDVGLAFGFLFAAVGAVVGGLGVTFDRPLPAVAEITLPVSSRSFLGRVLSGVGIGAVVGLGIGMVGGLLSGPVGLTDGAAAGVLGGMCAGAVLGLAAAFDGQSDVARAISPTSTLRTDRAGALTKAVAAGVGIGVLAGLLSGMLFGVVSGVAAGFVAGVLGRLSATAWGWFALARLGLAARRQLPWRLMAFLHDAHRYGVLRVAGGVYQFRHQRIQQWLVAKRDKPPARVDGPGA